MSELSDISTENVAKRRSPTDNTMMHGVTEKTATSSSFSVQVKNSLVNFFPLTMGRGTFESQLSLNSSTHKNGAPTNRETGSLDQFGVVRTTNKTIEGSQQSREFMTMTNSNMQPGKNWSTGPSNPRNRKRIMKKHRDR